MAKRVGIADVARAAGVSATTVSHALSGQGKVSAQTRARVTQVAADLGYAPNRLASALRRRRSGIIGFVSDEIATTPFAGQLVLGAQDAAAAAGFLLMVVNSNRDPLVEQDQIQALLGHQVDAIVYAKMSHQRIDVPDALHRVPTVLIDLPDSSGQFPSVIPNEEGIARAATELLLANGHRRIVHVTIVDDTPAKVGRLDGFRRALSAAGVPFHSDMVISAEVERGSAATGIARVAFGSYLDRGHRPTAVFCFNDQFAMGVYQAASIFGLSIPGDLSVVGVDNLELIAGNLIPGLTTVSLPHYEMGRWAVEAAAALIDVPSPSSRVTQPVLMGVTQPVLMDCLLIERESVSSPRATTAPEWRPSYSSDSR